MQGNMDLLVCLWQLDECGGKHGSKCVVVAPVVVAVVIVAVAMAVGVIYCVEKDWNKLMLYSTYSVLLGVNW